MVAGSLIVPFAAQAAPNDLDRSFGAGGVVLDRSLLGGLGEDGTGFRSLDVLGDGRAVVQMTERCSQECVQLAVARYTEDGRPDPALAGRPIGVVRPGPVTYESQTTGAAVAPDASVRVGYATPHPALTEVSPSGAVGEARPTADIVRPEVLRADGTLIARLGLHGRTLVRMRADDSPDPAFGRDGRRAIPAGVRAVAGVVAGNALRVGGIGTRGAVLWRVSTNGTGPGRVTQVPVGGLAEWSPLPGSFAVNAAGRSLQVAQVSYRPAGGGPLLRRSAVAVFLPDGRVDHAFGDRGVLRIRDLAVGAALQANGKVLLATRPSASDFAPRPLTVRRINPDGSPDPSFRPARVPSGGMGSVGAAAAAADGQGRIVVASGVMREYGDSGLVLARLRGGEAPALRLTSPKRVRANALRVVATSSVAGRARITVRQSGRVVGAKTVRFGRGSQKKVTVYLRRAKVKRPLAVRGTLKGVRATGVRAVAAR